MDVVHDHGTERVRVTILHPETNTFRTPELPMPEHQLCVSFNYCGYHVHSTTCTGDVVNAVASSIVGFTCNQSQVISMASTYIS
jgi:hypothetical protein